MLRSSFLFYFLSSFLFLSAYCDDCTKLGEILNITYVVDNNCTNISTLTLNKLDITDLTGLENVVQIRYFYITNNEMLQTVDGLDSLQYVQYLIISTNSNLTTVNILKPLHLISPRGSPYVEIEYNHALTMVNITIDETDQVNPAYWDFLSCDLLTDLWIHGVTVVQGVTVSSLAITDFFAFQNVKVAYDFNIRDCYSLTTVNLDSLVNVSSLTFYELYSLTAVTLPYGMTEASSIDFTDCWQLALLGLPDSLLRLPSLNLENLASLPSLDLPNSLQLNDSFSIINCSLINTLEDIADNIASELGDVQIENLPKLPSLHGLESVTSFSEIIIRSLPLLTNFSGLNSVTAIVSLDIYDLPALTSFQGLNSLRSLGDGIQIGVDAENLPSLSSFHGLESLQGIDGNIEVDNCPKLQNLKGLDNVKYAYFLKLHDNIGLQNLQGLNSLLTLQYGGIDFYNNSFTSLAGLESLLNMTGDLSIYNNPNLLSLNGLNGTLLIDGSVIIEENDELQTLAGLNSLQTITGTFLILNCPQFQSFNSLNSLTTMGGPTITITNLTGMQSVNGFNKIQDVVNISITNTGTVTIEGFHNLKRVTNFIIRNNDYLQDLLGLENLFVIRGVMEIVDNPDLRYIDSLAGIRTASAGILLQNAPHLCCPAYSFFENNVFSATSLICTPCLTLLSIAPHNGPTSGSLNFNIKYTGGFLTKSLDVIIQVGKNNISATADATTNQIMGVLPSSTAAGSVPITVFIDPTGALKSNLTFQYLSWTNWTGAPLSVIEQPSTTILATSGVPGVPSTHQNQALKRFRYIIMGGLLALGALLLIFYLIDTCEWVWTPRVKSSLSRVDLFPMEFMVSDQAVKEHHRQIRRKEFVKTAYGGCATLSAYYVILVIITAYCTEAWTDPDAVQVTLSPDTSSMAISTDFLATFTLHSFPLPCLADTTQQSGACGSFLGLAATGFSNRSRFYCNTIPTNYQPLCQIVWICDTCYAVLPYGSISISAGDISALTTMIEWSFHTTGSQGNSTLNGNISAPLNQVFRGSPYPQLSVKTIGINYSFSGDVSQGTMIQYEGVQPGSEISISQLSNATGFGLNVLVNRDSFLLDVSVEAQYSFFAAVAQLMAWGLAVLGVGRSTTQFLSNVCRRKVYSTIDKSQGIQMSSMDLSSKSTHNLQPNQGEDGGADLVPRPTHSVLSPPSQRPSALQLQSEDRAPGSSSTQVEVEAQSTGGEA